MVAVDRAEMGFTGTGESFHDVNTDVLCSDPRPSRLADGLGDWHWTLAERPRIVEVFQPKAVLIEADGVAIAGALKHRRDAAWQDAVTATPPAASGPDDADLPLVVSLSSGITAVPKGLDIGRALP